MCHQNQPSGFFKVWTFFRCFDRDLRELKQTNFFKKNAYLTSSWKFHRCIVLELLKLKKELGFRNLQEKLEKKMLSLDHGRKCAAYVCT